MKKITRVRHLAAIRKGSWNHEENEWARQSTPLRKTILKIYVGRKNTPYRFVVESQDDPVQLSPLSYPEGLDTRFPPQWLVKLAQDPSFADSLLAQAEPDLHSH